MSTSVPTPHKKNNLLSKIACLLIALLICCLCSISIAFSVYLYESDSEINYKIDQFLNLTGERKYDDKDFEVVFKDEYKNVMDRLEHATIYDLDVELDTDLDMINADAYITYFNNEEEELDEIYFRVYANSSSFEEEMVSFDEVRVDGREAQFIEDGSVYKLVLEDTLEANESVVIEFSFEEKLETATVGDDILSQSMDMMGALGGGTDQINHGLLGKMNEVYNLNYFAPIIPIYDEGWGIEELAAGYGDVYNFDYAKWKVDLVTDNDMVVASSGEVVETEVKEDKTTYSIVSVSRDFAIEVSLEFEIITEEQDGVEYNSYYTSTQKNGKSGLEVLMSSVAEYEKFLSEYPYKEFDIVETPLKGGAGGLESTGMIMIGEFVYNLDGGDSLLGMDMLSLFGDMNLGMEDMLEFTIAHETAHQWWHSIVGSDEVTNPWVDESLTNYSAVIYFEKKYGLARRDEIIESQLKGPYLQMKMMGVEDAVVDQPVSNFDILQYGGVVYGKGGLYYHKLRELVGDEIFFDSLEEYIEKYCYGHVQSRDLLEIILENSDKDSEIQALYTRWIQETHGDEDIGQGSQLTDLLGGMDQEDLSKLLEELLGGSEELEELFENMDSE